MRQSVRSAVGMICLATTLATVQGEPPATDAANRKLADALNQPLGAFKESGTNFKDVVDHFRDRTQCNVFINWKAVEAAGINRDMPVTIDLSGMPAGAGLQKFLNEAGGDTRLGFEIDSGVLTISTAEDLAMNVQTRTYDVRVLLNGNDAERAGRVAGVIRRVQGIDPRSWKANGGKIGTVRELGGQLIVTQTPIVHQRIAKELAIVAATEPTDQENRKTLVAELIAESRRLNQQGRYKESLKLVEAILVTDPKNEYATSVRAILFDKPGLQTQRTIEEEEKVSPLRQGKLDPIIEKTNYPATLPDVGGRHNPNAPDAATAGQALLQKKIPEIRFDAVALSDTIDYLRDTTQINLFVDWASLEVAGVDRNAPVSCRLKNISVRRVVDTVLQSVSPPDNATSPDALMSYLDPEGVLTISTKRKLYTVAAKPAVYPIGDLMTARGNADPAARAAELATLIKSTIAPDTWATKPDEVGGKLTVENNALVVSQLPDVQAAIAGVLAKLREQANPSAAPAQ